VGTALQVVVVGNDPAGSEKSVCDEFAALESVALNFSEGVLKALT